MCGYCTEKLAMTALAGGQFPADMSTRGWYRALWLQEAPNLNALDWLPEGKLCNGEAVVWMGRAAQLQIFSGFDTFECQTKLNSSRFFDAVDWYCDPLRRLALAGEQYGFPATPFAWLTNRNTWLQHGVFASKCAALSNGECRALINGYAAAHFDHESSDARNVWTQESSADSLGKSDAINGPIECWVVPMIVAIGVLRKREDSSEETYRALRPIFDAPAYSCSLGFEALELWLERQAAQAVCELFGAGPFIGDAAGIRAEIFQYLALTGAIME